MTMDSAFAEFFRAIMDVEPMTEEQIREEYVHMRTLPDGRVCGVHKLLMHWALHVEVHAYGYEDRYCYQTVEGAIAALEAWDGTGDPVGWHRHPRTARRRNIATGEEWIAP